MGRQKTIEYGLVVQLIGDVQGRGEVQLEVQSRPVFECMTTTFIKGTGRRAIARILQIAPKKKSHEITESLRRIANIPDLVVYRGRLSISNKLDTNKALIEMSREINQHPIRFTIHNCRNLDRIKPLRK